MISFKCTRGFPKNYCYIRLMFLFILLTLSVSFPCPSAAMNVKTENIFQFLMTGELSRDSKPPAEAPKIKDDTLGLLGGQQREGEQK